MQMLLDKLIDFIMKILGAIRGDMGSSTLPIIDANLTIDPVVAKGKQNVGRMIVDTFGTSQPVCLYATIEDKELGVQYDLGDHIRGLEKIGAEISSVKAKCTMREGGEEVDVVIGVANKGEEGIETFMVVQGDVATLQDEVEVELDRLRQNGELEQRVQDWVWNKARADVLNDNLIGDYIDKGQVLDAIATIRGKKARLGAFTVLSDIGGRLGKSIAGIAFDTESGYLHVVDKSDPDLVALVTALGLDEAVREHVHGRIIGQQLSEELTKEYGDDMSKWPPEAILYPIVLDNNLREFIRIDQFNSSDLSRLLGDEKLDIESLLEGGSALVFLSRKVKDSGDVKNASITV